MTDQQTLNRALEFHGSGNLGEAEKLYRDLLENDPGQPDALHYLGVIGLQVGRFEDADSRGPRPKLVIQRRFDRSEP